MADEYVLKHLQDVLDAINELEGFFADYPRRFDLFEKDRLRICAVERKTEIMGEAITAYGRKTLHLRFQTPKKLSTHATGSYTVTTVWSPNFCGAWL